MTDTPEYVLDREFKAPRAMVWRAWTEPELLARWYGPGVETVIHQYDLKPGGLWLNEMRWGENADYTKMTFAEVTPTERLVWRTAATDADWNVVANPRMPDWPRNLLTIVTFADAGNTTNVRLVWTPQDASAAEIACFTAATENLGKGWGAGYAILDEIFAELT